MLLYLTSSGKSTLVDAATQEIGQNVKKLTGKFSLKCMVTRDMRNYAAVHFFVVDACCCEELPEEFCIALQSFQLMFSARIIVILSGCDNMNAYLSRLISVGVVNIVTAKTPSEVKDELLECLSEDGMQRYLQQYEAEESKGETEPDAAQFQTDEEIPVYKWKAEDVKIAVAGSQRRCGTTMTAFNLACWLSARGADVAFVEMNTNRHLHLILHVYEAQKEQEHYTIDNMDFYLTDELDRAYNFIIYDCGVLNAIPLVFRDADKRLLCGAVLPYELADFHKAVSLCGSLPVEKIGVGVPDEMKEYCVSIFGEDLWLAETSRSLFDVYNNSAIYKEIVKEYIY